MKLLKGKVSVTKLGAVLAVGAIAFGTLGTMPTMALTNPSLYKIVHTLGINKDLTPYENMVGQSVTKEGITMTINEVIVDNDQLIVSVTTTSKESLVDRYACPTAFAYINGQEINNGMYSLSSELIDDYTGHAVLAIPVGEDLTGELDIKLQLSTPLSDMERSPHWNYEFTATGEALAAETTIYDIHQSTTLDNGSTIQIEKYSTTPFSDKIYFSVENNTEDNFFHIQGQDQDGNEVIFNWKMMNQNQGEMLAEKGYANVIQNATTLTLSLYADGEAIGEAFVINK